MGAQGVPCVDLMGAEEAELKKRRKILLPVIVISLGCLFVSLYFSL